MDKFWTLIWSAVCGVAALFAGKVVDQYYPTELVGRFFTFLSTIPAWYLEPVGVPRLLLVDLVVALIAALGFIAWKKFVHYREEKASEAPVPMLKPEVKVAEEQRHVLTVIANAINAGVPLTVKKIFDFAGMDQLNFNHALHELQNNSLIHTYVSYQKGKMLQLTPAGTKYVVDHDLAHKRIVNEFGGQRPR
ncbi:hypothetical protein WHX55_15750 [Pseudomonas fluorescens]|uniref:hypothetical protein n=1 Tax=Pseudomonas fluorescens TaxID=294 RepID=UPI00324E2208